MKNIFDYFNKQVGTNADIIQFQGIVASNFFVAMDVAARHIGFLKPSEGLIDLGIIVGVAVTGVTQILRPQAPILDHQEIELEKEKTEIHKQVLSNHKNFLVKHESEIKELRSIVLTQHAEINELKNMKQRLPVNEYPVEKIESVIERSTAALEFIGDKSTLAEKIDTINNSQDKTREQKVLERAVAIVRNRNKPIDAKKHHIIPSENKQEIKSINQSGQSR